MDRDFEAKAHELTKPSATKTHLARRVGKKLKKFEIRRLRAEKKNGGQASGPFQTNRNAKR